MLNIKLSFAVLAFCLVYSSSLFPTIILELHIEAHDLIIVIMLNFVVLRCTCDTGVFDKGQ